MLEPQLNAISAALARSDDGQDGLAGRRHAIAEALARTRRLATDLELALGRMDAQIYRAHVRELRRLFEHAGPEELEPERVRDSLAAVWSDLVRRMQPG